MPKQHIYVSRIRELIAIKEQLLERPIMLKELADVAGVSRPLISYYANERGVNTLPQADVQARLNDFFGVPFSAMWKLVTVEGDDTNGR